MPLRYYAVTYILRLPDMVKPTCVAAYVGQRLPLSSIHLQSFRDNRHINTKNCTAYFKHPATQYQAS